MRALGSQLQVAVDVLLLCSPDGTDSTGVSSGLRKPIYVVFLSCSEWGGSDGPRGLVRLFEQHLVAGFVVVGPKPLLVLASVKQIAHCWRVRRDFGSDDVFVRRWNPNERLEQCCAPNQAACSGAHH